MVGNDPSSSIAEGQALGLEFTYQQKLYKGFYGILAYTLVRSEFEDKNGILRPLLGQSPRDDPHSRKTLWKQVGSRNAVSVARWRPLHTNRPEPVPSFNWDVLAGASRIIHDWNTERFNTFIG